SGKKEDMEVIIDKMPSIHVLNKVYQNKGDLSFKDVGISWGFNQPSFSNGAAYGDLDNDGDLDVVVNNVNQPAFVYKNNSRELNQNSYIAISLTGTDKNKFAVGSKIKIYEGNQVLNREVIPSRGFQSSMDYKIVFGLGEAKQVDSMIIQWPDLSYSKYIRPGVNKVYKLNENEEKKYPMPALKSPVETNTMFTQVKNNPGGRTGAFEKHTEDDYVDFFYERNIPRMLSREGPKAAVGDVNGDGLEDVFIGGTAGHPGQLYLQTKDGQFVKRDEKAFDQFADFEDVAVLLFDCDTDGDLDLLICPGGNDVPIGSRQLQLRLFKNDGKGDFEIDPNAFPLNSANISVAAACDFDNDGDLDLFIGGRSVPIEYGLNPSSYLFVNNGNGHFADIAKNKNPDIANIGMVTGATWADVTGDSKKELIIVGEWMGPRIFSFDTDHFKEIKTNISNLYGWWQTVATADINGDGKQDLVLGNIGENFYLRPDSTHPVKLWISDFDQNGINDKILTYTVDGKDKPVFLKHDLEDAMPFLKKNNLKHAEYATKSVQELIPAEALKKALVKQFDFSPSCVAINKGNGQFTVEKLPPMIQLSSVNAIHCMDLNNDGKIDIVCGGNQFDFIPQLERLDASMGDVLINQGNHSLRTGQAGFTWVEPARTGLDLRGQLRDIEEIHMRGEDYLLFLQNDEYPVLYQVKDKIK
ncbi:MAG TPA: FG-GAP-like repeat-containing protein, partial [Chitinophagaceae bacterium]|nr:FG-GAP-like repeat-containing protein [Chitinophagaceae bacterium]